MAVIILVPIAIVGTLRRWMVLFDIEKPVTNEYGDNVLEVVAE